MMNKHYVLFVLIISFLSASCSGQMDAMLPKSLDSKGAARLVSTMHDETAASLFSDDAIIKEALTEFKPQGVSAGVYNYGGIIIRLGLARCVSSDDAFGIYSALSAMPRERWEYKKGEMSYRSPYFTGYNGEYVFWTCSPTNPMTYASFYREHGERLLDEFDRISQKPGCSYHWKILPAENRYADSIFFVRSRNVQGIDIENAYAATYQVKKNIARIYIQNSGLDDTAEKQFLKQVKKLQAAGKKPKEYIPLPGAPVSAVKWKEQGGEWSLLQYRWLIILLTDMPSHMFCDNFIKIMFNNMMKIRNEVMPAGKNTASKNGTGGN
jgi:hypothetical protein